MAEKVWRSDGDPGLPLVVSYFTDDAYRREAWELARSLHQHGVQGEIYYLNDAGSWKANTNSKPKFLLDRAREMPGRDLLWLDADARIRARPALFEQHYPCDIAWRTWHMRPASGTVFLPATRRRELILERWVASVERDPIATDQVCMGRAVAALGLNHRELPVEYCWIYDFNSETQAHVAEPEPKSSDPVVVEHMQYSRLARRMQR